MRGKRGRGGRKGRIRHGKSLGGGRGGKKMMMIRRKRRRRKMDRSRAKRREKWGQREGGEEAEEGEGEGEGGRVRVDSPDRQTDFHAELVEANHSFH